MDSSHHKFHASKSGNIHGEAADREHGAAKESPSIAVEPLSNPCIYNEYTCPNKVDVAFSTAQGPSPCDLSLMALLEGANGGCPHCILRSKLVRATKSRRIVALQNPH